MANSFLFKETRYKVGDTVSINYKIKEGDKERLQLFKGIIVKIKGDSEATRMFTVRKLTRSGIGVERIIPMMSPNIASMTLDKKSNYNKAKLYFLRNLTDQEVKTKLYQTKTVKTKSKTKKTAVKK